jgi:hypothetical protein
MSARQIGVHAGGVERARDDELGEVRRDWREGRHETIDEARGKRASVTGVRAGYLPELADGRRLREELGS